MGSTAAYHHAQEVCPGTQAFVQPAGLLHSGPLLTVLTASRWYASKGIRCGLTRHSKGCWEITPRTGTGLTSGIGED